MYTRRHRRQGRASKRGAAEARAAAKPRRLPRRTADKLECLRCIIGRRESALIAFSGGVDSTFLLAVARDVLGPRLLAVTAASSVVQPREVTGARKLARALGVKHEVISANEVMDMEEFCGNPPDRCYYCKTVLFSRLSAMARERGLDRVMEASNADDTSDYRPGLRAVKELRIESPLIEAGLAKAEIRALSREMGLPTWNKPSLACLASRFPYNERITDEKLEMVRKAEEYILSLGFSSCRVRYYGKLARIEVPAAELGRLATPSMRAKVARRLRAIGFQYVTVDLEGYRSGSMNVVLGKQPRRRGA